MTCSTSWRPLRLFLEKRKMFISGVVSSQFNEPLLIMRVGTELRPLTRSKSNAKGNLTKRRC
jgi:hypothetical protein